MFYYDVYRAQTSNATLNTEDKVAAMRTIANQRTCGIASLKLAGRYNGPGGVVLRLKTCATISTGGAAITPGKRDPGAPAAETTVFDSTYTAGGTPVIREVVGVAAQGGYGGWFAATPEELVTLRANGGANGNAELTLIAGLASVPVEATLLFAEL